MSGERKRILGIKQYICFTIAPPPQKKKKWPNDSYENNDTALLSNPTTTCLYLTFFFLMLFRPYCRVNTIILFRKRGEKNNNCSGNTLFDVILSHNLPPPPVPPLLLHPIVVHWSRHDPLESSLYSYTFRSIITGILFIIFFKERALHKKTKTQACKPIECSQPFRFRNVPGRTDITEHCETITLNSLVYLGIG